MAYEAFLRCSRVSRRFGKWDRVRGRIDQAEISAGPDGGSPTVSSNAFLYCKLTTDLFRLPKGAIVAYSQSSWTWSPTSGNPNSVMGLGSAWYTTVLVVRLTFWETWLLSSSSGQHLPFSSFDHQTDNSPPQAIPGARHEVNFPASTSFEGIVPPNAKTVYSGSTFRYASCRACRCA
jgi:hypothetical protein